MPQVFDDSAVDSRTLGHDQDEIGDAQDIEDQNDTTHEPETPAVPVEILPHDGMRSEPLLTNVLVELYDGETDEQGFLHGYGTAYFQGGSIYKGDFQRGLMHGKGKYVWNNRTIYEGDFAGNELCGYGRYIWPDDSVYEGEVKNGLRHGQGTFKCSLSPCVYSGMWVNGKRHGRGTLKYDKEGTSYYEGEWYENQRQGYGIRRYASGNVYEGNWKNSVRHGQGTMNWYTSNEKYSGKWSNGVQQGYGEHTWFLRRIKRSQYPLRNRYVGNFVNGLRHGRGIFYYASGARYDGEWMNNMKHGNGIFVFKNGTIFKGLFDNDHMLEYPDINPSGMMTPDIASVGFPVQRPGSPASILSADWTNGLELNIAFLFDDRDIDLDQRESEIQQVNYVMLQHISKLKKIYTFYSSIGTDQSLDNTSVMSRMQFCRFLKDIQIHHENTSLPLILRLIAEKENTDPYNPWENILTRDFLTALVIIANHLFADEHCNGNQLLLPWCLSRLISEHVLPHACKVGGLVYSQASTAVELRHYLDGTYAVYQYWITHTQQSQPLALCISMRHMLLLLKDLGFINENLTAKHIVDIFASSDLRVAQDEFISLELEISFLEVFEALVQCAEVYVTLDMLRESPTIQPCTSSQAPSRKSCRSSVFSPDNVSEGRVSYTLNVIEEKPEGNETPPAVEQKPNEITPPKGIEIPLLSITASTTGSPKQLVIDYHGEAGKDEGSKLGDSQDLDESQTVKQDGKQNEGEGKKCDPIEFEDDFSLWCMKMHYFFKKKFFPAAEKYELLNKLAQDKV